MKLLGVAPLLLVAGCTVTPNYCEPFFYEHAYSNGYVELIELKRVSCFNTTNHHDVFTGGGDGSHSNPTPASAAVSTGAVSTGAVSTGAVSTGSVSTAAVSTGSVSTGSVSTGSVSTGAVSTGAVSASPGMPDAGFGIGHDAIGFEGGYTGGPVSFE